MASHLLQNVESVAFVGDYVTSSLSKASMVLPSIWNTFVAAGTSVLSVAEPFALKITPDIFERFNAPIDELAAVVGMSRNPDAVKLVFILLLMFPIAGLLSVVRVPFLKHIINATAGIFLSQWLYGVQWCNSFIVAVVSYVIMVLARFVPIISRYQHLIIFAWVMGFLTLGHLWRLHTDYLGWSVDYTASQMILTIKLTSLGYNLWDGQNAERYKSRISECEKKIKALSNGPQSPDIEKKKSQLTLEVKKLQSFLKRSVSRLPSILSYLGYVYAPYAFFAGPAFEYYVYEQASSEILFKDPVTGKRSYHWGSRLKAVTWKTLSSFVFLGLQLYATTHGMNAQVLADPATRSSFVRTELYSFVLMFFTRTKYYFAWLIAEAATNLAGLGYTPATAAVERDGKIIKPAQEENWSGIRNIDIPGYEFAVSFSAAAKAWNCGTQNWLHNYAYIRSPRHLQLYITYFLSAFWHGFYPGYYLSFLSAPIGQTFERHIRSKFSSRVPTSLSKVYNLICMFFTQVTLNYIFTPFLILSWSDSIAFWSRLYFFGHVIAFLGIIILSIVPAKREKHKKSD